MDDSKQKEDRRKNNEKILRELRRGRSPEPSVPVVRIKKPVYNKVPCDVVSLSEYREQRKPTNNTTSKETEK